MYSTWNNLCWPEQDIDGTQNRSIDDVLDNRQPHRPMLLSFLPIHVDTLLLQNLSVYGHNGSHAFLIDDFVRAVLTNKLPPVDPWLASYCTLAGIYAHKSAMMGGVTLKLPDLGEAPDDWEHVCFDDIRYDG